MVRLDGLDILRRQTSGDPRVCVAVLDGPVDRSHPSLAGAALAEVETTAPSAVGPGWASRHGTFVASLIFGRGGPVEGIAPGCRGLVVPIFRDAPGGGVIAGSQLELARAIGLAAAHGARIINVSGGELSATGHAFPILSETAAACAKAGILIVAAAGNDGCECQQVPAALPSVLAVGGLDERGRPLGSSNWGRSYRGHGLASPASVVGATLDGGAGRDEGTSYAAAVVSGVAALLMSLDLKRGLPPDGPRIRDALLSTAEGCGEDDDPLSCRRLLVGRLNLPRANTFFMEHAPAMTETRDTGHETRDAEDEARVAPSAPVEVAGPLPAPAPIIPPAPAVLPSACGCGCSGPRSLAYALGQIGFDLVGEARRDSIRQNMDGDDPNPHDVKQMLAYLDAHPWEAASITWTLNFDQTPIYAVAPQGPFAADAYNLLRSFLAESGAGEIERVAVPGVISGKVALLNGQVVPAIVPELRGMSSWTTGALAEAVAGAAPAKNAAEAERSHHGKKLAGVRNMLERVYHELRNLGVMPQERAINYAATNALLIGQVFESAVKEEMELDSIEAERSPVCRPDSDCWDVRLEFFYPQRQVQTVRRAFRFTVDVSDVVPVMVGPSRSWYVR